MIIHFRCKKCKEFIGDNSIPDTSKTFRQYFSSEVIIIMKIKKGIHVEVTCK